MEVSTVFSSICYVFRDFLDFVCPNPERLANVYFISRFDPIQEQLIWQFPSILFGTLFIFMARLIRRRVKGAFVAYP